jgi:hypothetical protein
MGLELNTYLISYSHISCNYMLIAEKYKYIYIEERKELLFFKCGSPMRPVINNKKTQNHIVRNKKKKNYNVFFSFYQ